MGILDAIHHIDEVEGLEHLKKYYLSEAEYFTGSQFERIGAESSEENVFTPADLYSVAALGVDVPAGAGIAILGTEATMFNGLLGEIPVDLKIGSLSESEFERVLGRESKAQNLWDRLLRNGPGESKWFVGSTLASKLMARKRPHLIPIEDSVVNRVINLGRGDSWRLWWGAFQTEGDYLERRADRLRTEIGRPELSTLRVFDVMLWMWGKDNA
ncbi:DUF6308 family protein [Brevibacterium linens]|uniref:Uncharacterized protein n=1 Tax=Brevibacterium linens TaxID=1703 RepID=A0A0B9AXG4_BRELN|nr:DUF6308 family protein [Brevibacterium linens]KHS54040.1 hypothetical protein AE0388_0501 [Brevibacterium linens]